jgi:hypothetical protein
MVGAAAPTISCLHTLMMKQAIGAIFPLLAVLIAAGDEPRPLPPAEEVVRRVIAREEQVEKRLERSPRYLFTQHSREERLDKDGTVTERTERVYRATLIEGRVYLRLAEKNGQPLSGDEAKKEAEREKKFRERLRRPQTDKKGDDDEVRLNEELVSRYQFHVIGREVLSGREALVVTFLPRTNVKLPERRRMDKVLNRLEGKVWVDAETYSLVKVDMHLTEPATLAGGLGAVRSLDFLIELFAVDPETFVPRELRIAFEGRKLFRGMRVKQSATYSDYHKIEATAASKE